MITSKNGYRQKIGLIILTDLLTYFYTPNLEMLLYLKNSGREELLFNESKGLRLMKVCLLLYQLSVSCKLVTEKKTINNFHLLVHSLGYKLQLNIWLNITRSHSLNCDGKLFKFNIKEFLFTWVEEEELECFEFEHLCKPFPTLILYTFCRFCKCRTVLSRKLPASNIN